MELECRLLHAIQELGDLGQDLGQEEESFNGRKTYSTF